MFSSQAYRVTHPPLGLFLFGILTKLEGLIQT